MKEREGSLGSDVAVEFGKRLRARREALNLTLRELGQRLKTRDGKPVSHAQIWRWEKGRDIPKRWRWSELAGALETTVDGLFGDLLIEAQDETVAERLAATEDRLNALAHLLGVGEAELEAAVRRAKSRRRPDPTKAAQELEALEKRSPQRGRSSRAKGSRAGGD